MIRVQRSCNYVTKTTASLATVAITAILEGMRNTRTESYGQNHLRRSFSSTQAIYVSFRGTVLKNIMRTLTVYCFEGIIYERVLTMSNHCFVFSYVFVIEDVDDEVDHEGTCILPLVAAEAVSDGGNDIVVHVV